MQGAENKRKDGREKHTDIPCINNLFYP